MPSYDYHCRTCEARFEVRQSFSEDSLRHCPAAGSAQSPASCVAPGSGEVRKIFSAPSITFKGDGFYKTDSRSGAGRSTNGSSASKPDSGTEGSGESSRKTSDSAPSVESADGSGSSNDSGKSTDGGGRSSDRAPVASGSS